jgi:V/A-type H+-transporting ATPase subunit I
MLVKMKKITIAILAAKEARTLENLRELGILHVEHVRNPESPDIENKRTQISRLEKALQVLSTRKARNKGKRTPPDPEMVNKVLAIVEQESLARDRLSDLLRKIEGLGPLGHFSKADLDDLMESGIFARVYHATKHELKKAEIHVPHKIIPARGSRRYVLALSTGDFTLPYEEIQVPEKGLAHLQGEAEALERNMDLMGQQLDELAASTHDLDGALLSLQEQLEFSEVLCGMGKSGDISYLQAYCPEDGLERLKRVSREAGWGLLTEEPDEEDPVPTLIKNPRWLRMIQPIFDFMGIVPGYREFDVSFWFLLSLSIFFAMIIGDGGYGLLFLLTTLMAKRVMKTVPSELFSLLTVMSTATIVWGVVTGTWFGVEGLSRLPVLKDLIIPAVNSYAENQGFMLKLCFLLGAFHLTIAHAIRFFRFINSLHALAEIGWMLIVWFLYSLACHLVLAERLPSLAFYLLASGLFLASAFSNPSRHFIKSFFLAFANLPLNVIQSFSDVVSYLRLFAVGYATLVVAMSFNQMAYSVGWAEFYTGLSAALILFMGHALNILLGGMAVLVHGVRLNMLEFSSHLGLHWSGHPFKPFRRWRTGT